MSELKDLSSTEQLVLLHLGDITNTNTGRCNPSQSTLAERANITRQAVAKAINGLETKGYIVRQRVYRNDGGKAPCNYIVNVDRLVMRKPRNVNHGHIPCKPRLHTHANDVVDPCKPGLHTHANDVYINQAYKPSIEPEDKPPLPPKGGTVPKATKPKFDAKAMTVPDALNADAWHEWIEYRVDRRKPITQLSAKKQVAELAKYPHETQQQMVDTSIANGWQGLFPPKVNGNTMSAEAKAQRDNDLMVGARLLAEAAMRKRTPH